MGELHDAVTALLDAFARGISVIREQRSRRKEERLAVDPVQQTAETHVRKSLKKSRSDVDEAYRRDLARYGPGFAAGDAEARSSLSKILLRLNAAFVSIIERFTKGRSTRADYHTLMSLSDASRLEAIHTFDQLSRRLPQSTLSLTSSIKPSARDAQKRRIKRSASAKDAHHPRSKSAPAPAMAVAAAVASDEPRHRHARQRGPGSSKSSTVISKSKTPRATLDKHRSTTSRKPTASSNSNNHPRVASPAPGSTRTSSRRGRRRHVSGSSRSDSTKLGEIPEHKWRTTKPRDDDSSLEIAYPLYSYPAPPKQRSRFMRFWGK